MNDLPDYYAILGLPPDADQRLIEKTYRRLARQYHPDVNPSPEAHARMVAINEAYAVLRDPVQRARYDAQRRLLRDWLSQAPLEYHGRNGLRGRARHDAIQMMLFWQRQKQRWQETFLRQVQQVLRAYGYRRIQKLPGEEAHWMDQIWQRGTQLWYVRLQLQPVTTPKHIAAFAQARQKVPQARASLMSAGDVWPQARQLAKREGIVVYDRPALKHIWDRARRRGRNKKA